MCFNETLQPLFSTIPTTHSTTATNTHNATPNITIISHSLDDANSNTEYDGSLANSSDVDEEVVNELLITSHLQLL